MMVTRASNSTLYRRLRVFVDGPLEPEAPDMKYLDPLRNLRPSKLESDTPRDLNTVSSQSRGANGGVMVRP